MYREIQKTVFKILQDDKKARNNDNYLICEVLKKYNLSTDIKDLKDKRISFESITRARRLLQKTNPNLRANESIQKLRGMVKEEILDVVRDKGCANG